MPLPDWMTRLLDVGPETEPPDDRDFERDQAAVDAKLAPYRGIRYPAMPPDPRVIDTSRVLALRNRLLDPYAYRWRHVEAIDEIMDALFEPLIQSQGERYALGTNTIFLNARGESPSPRNRMPSNDFKKFHYITVRSLRLGDFLTSYEDAMRLLNNVLPDWGFTARVMTGGTEIRLERGETHRAWIGGAGIATLIVAAMLDLLAQSPQEAKPWRSV
ncbi:hypothetical protein [Methylobacterium haplocladii]|uniref:Uncharacterized protein n=1 Tax=Methylobacterium haplocladii TaxID=1176176 RepID=A0A512INE1_9HYPH|nr:hypothetical protein [Methylobacterium haplocladii]GEO99210.1 hypothetical protein MHA02_15980 [Methylobacterium haplocladii]GLS59086.1 hypothetical protein GCM10007887_17520 [Methylobacterium haplocladii]